LVVDARSPSFAHFHLRLVPTPSARAHDDAIVDTEVPPVVDIRLFAKPRQVTIIGRGRSR
jgi:hypothetical protein